MRVSVATITVGLQAGVGRPSRNQFSFVAGCARRLGVQIGQIEAGFRVSEVPAPPERAPIDDRTLPAFVLVVALDAGPGEGRVQSVLFRDRLLQIGVGMAIKAEKISYAASEFVTLRAAVAVVPLLMYGTERARGDAKEAIALSTCRPDPGRSHHHGDEQRTPCRRNRPWDEQRTACGKSNDGH